MDKVLFTLPAGFRPAPSPLETKGFIHLSTSFNDEGETIDGGAPYEFDPTKDVPVVPVEEDVDLGFDDASHDGNVTSPESLVGASMSRRQTLMTLQSPGGGDFAYFANINEETGQQDDAIHMTYDNWDAFGQPDIVTVTVEPGDHLNR
jgi:hypothetical protein